MYSKLRTTYWFASTMMLLLVVSSLCFAELPPDIPGEEITDQNLLTVTPHDSTVKADTTKSAPVEWYDKVAKTWEAPTISEQMSADRTIVPIGKGGIFIPRLTELHKEPDIEVIDSIGGTVCSGEPGKTYSVEPGRYSVLIGSGTHRQKIVRQVEVQEFKTVPVLPDWSGLIIETVDTTSAVFKGDYELVRIDEFEPYGRGLGADVGLGESVKSWILKPGIYKILGRGASYNTYKNFVTVRLLPGELSRFILIQRPDDFAILGGGTVDITPGNKITSNWKYGGNLGFNIQFFEKVDRKSDVHKDMASNLSANTSLWLRYLKNPVEWETKIGLIEGFNLSKQKTDYALMDGDDDFKLRSLFIWRFYPWLGPYGSTDITTTLLPKNLSRDDKGYFSVLHDDYTIDLNSIDSTSTYKLNTSFCPLSLVVSGGVNVDALNASFLNVALRIGAGGSYTYFPEKYIEIPYEKVLQDSLNKIDSTKFSNGIFLRKEKQTNLVELGPLGSISGNLRLGRFGTASAELKVFAPVYPEERFLNPDYDFSTIISWRIIRSVTLDYIFNFLLKQPAKEESRVNKATNTVLIRFSYSSR